jgi:hypothetical protein
LSALGLALLFLASKLRFPSVAGRECPSHISVMCGRVIQSSGPIRYGIVEGLDVQDSRAHNYPPRWNAAPSQDFL